MSLQLALRQEEALADDTLEVADVRMLHLMSRKALLRNKCLTALFTHVRPGAIVNL